MIIASYPKDYPFLIHCLASMRKFAGGFIPPVVCVDTPDEASAKNIVAQSYPEATVIVKQGRPNQGMIRAELSMMRADELCPQADIIHFVGSDCLAFEPFDASIYCAPDGKAAVLYSSYLSMNLVHPDTVPWRKGTQRILGINVENEFMRRIPSVFPREIFEPMRKYVAKIHKMQFDDYIYMADWRQMTEGKVRDTSEANILGAYAHHFMPETCHWVDVATAGLYGSQIVGWPSSIIQYWSHKGLDHPADTCVDYMFNGVKKNTVGRAPRSSINEILYGIESP